MRKLLLILSLSTLLLAALACRITGSVLVFSPSQLPDAQAGQPYEVTIIISGNRTPLNDIYVSDGQLPPGLTLYYEHPNDYATLRGTPQEAGQFKFTIAGDCLGTNVAGQTGDHAYSLVVK